MNKNSIKRLASAFAVLCLFVAIYNNNAVAGTPIPIGNPSDKNSKGGASRMPNRYPLYLELEDKGDIDSLIFYYQGAEPVSYSLYSEDGELQLQDSCLFDSDGKCQVPLDGLAPGTYTITIMVGCTMYEGTFLFG